MYRYILIIILFLTIILFDSPPSSRYTYIINEDLSIDISINGCLDIKYFDLTIPKMGFAYWKRGWIDFTHQKWWGKCKITTLNNSVIVSGNNSQASYIIHICRLNDRMASINLSIYFINLSEIEAVAWGSWNLDLNRWSGRKIIIYSWSGKSELYLPASFKMTTIFYDDSCISVSYPSSRGILSFINLNLSKTSIVDERRWGDSCFSFRYYLNLDGNKCKLNIILYTTKNIDNLYWIYRSLKLYHIYCSTIGFPSKFYSLFINESFYDAYISIRGEIRNILKTVKCNNKWISVENNRIIDEEGYNIYLYGANYIGMEFGWFHQSERDFILMKNWGFNVIRLPIGWQYIEPRPGYIDEDYLFLIDRIIYFAKKYGIYVILDMHQWHWSPKYGGCGMPGWLIMDAEDYRDASIKFFTNKEYWDRFANIWRILANRYRDESIIIGYDIFNEPMPKYSVLPKNIFKKYISDFYNYVIDRIREIDRNHIILFMSIWGSDKDSVPTIFDKNSILTIHYYVGDTWDGVTGYEKTSYSELEKEVRDWINIARKVGKPLWIGEFGVGSSAYMADKWVKDVTNIFDKYVLGYCWWAFWRDASKFGLLYVDGSEKKHIINILDRPHIYKTNINIVKINFDLENKALKITLSNNFSIGYIEIYVSKRHIEDPIIVSNARINYIVRKNIVLIKIYGIGKQIYIKIFDRMYDPSPRPQYLEITLLLVFLILLLYILLNILIYNRHLRTKFSKM